MNTQNSLVSHIQMDRRGRRQRRAVEKYQATLIPIEPEPVTVNLDPEHLDAYRIVAFDATDPRTKPIDTLRRSILQTMAERQWSAIGVLPVTTGCGATLTAVNLAVSMTRDFGRKVLLVDGDPNTPRIANYLGIVQPTELKDMALVQCTVGMKFKLDVLRLCDAFSSPSWATLDSMTNGIARARTYFRSSTMVVDLPPPLESDMALPILAQLDCAVLIARAGLTTADQIEQCLGIIPAAQLVEIVLNRTGDC